MTKAVYWAKVAFVCFCAHAQMKQINAKLLNTACNMLVCKNLVRTAPNHQKIATAADVEFLWDSV